MTERRRYERIKIQLTGSIKDREIERGLTRPSVAILDLSLGGAYCEIGRYLPPLTKVMLSLNFPGDAEEEAAVCRGVVVRVEPEEEEAERENYKVGILFTEISREDRDKLKHFLGRQLEKGSG
ncbi:MAG: PilZ domain-containing protein [Candidatus Glassbacteria bacterium]